MAQGAAVGAVGAVFVVVAEAPRSASVSTTQPIAAVSDVFAGGTAGSVAATARSVMSCVAEEYHRRRSLSCRPSGVAVVDSPDGVEFDPFRFSPSVTRNPFVLFLNHFWILLNLHRIEFMQRRD